MVTPHPASAVLYGDPPPGGDVELIEASDGVTLRGAYWPPVGSARGAILLSQGRTEYIEKAYDWIAKFRARGLHVYAFDFRGQGLSQRLLANRRKGYVSDFGQFQHDFDAAYAALRARVGDQPMLVFGHSMGGLAATQFLSRRQGELSGAILSTPMYGLALGPVVSFLAGMLAKAATALGFGERYVQGCDDRSGPDRGFDGNVLTHDRTRFDTHTKMFETYPDLVLGGTTHGWLAAGYREMRAVGRLPDDWLKVPVLIGSADQDTVVSNKAIARFVARNPLAQSVFLKGSRHEPLMETDDIQAVFWGGIDEFLDGVLGEVKPT